MYLSVVILNQARGLLVVLLVLSKSTNVPLFTDSLASSVRVFAPVRGAICGASQSWVHKITLSRTSAGTKTSHGDGVRGRLPLVRAHYGLQLMYTGKAHVSRASLRVSSLRYEFFRTRAQFRGIKEAHVIQKKENYHIVQKVAL
jgi:hypothetical protein